MVKIRFTRNHNGYLSGEELECEPSIADAICNWAQAAVMVEPIAAGKTPQDKSMRPKGGKSKVHTK